MKVAIVTDGNSQLGMGHVYQSMTLASLLRERMPGIQIVFLTKSNEIVTSLISTQSPIVYSLENDDAIFAALKKMNPDRIIFDKLDVSPDLALRIKKSLPAKLAIFTNLTDANEYADMTVLADIGSDFKNIYRKDPGTGKVSFWGTRYWLLRPEFYDLKRKQKARREDLKNITLIFGGADPCNFSTLVLKELLNSSQSFNISVVLGGAFSHEGQFNDVVRGAAASHSSVRVLKSINNVGQLMFQSDLVCASPGLSFFEALAVGTPVLAFHQSALQAKVYKTCFPTYGRNEVDKVNSLIENKKFIYPDHPFVQSLEIGEGKDDLLNEILN